MQFACFSLILGRDYSPNTITNRCAMNTGQKLMISYSRRQTPFVDRLADELEDSGYSIWVDYRSLVPARPWYQQIEASVCEADALLLVVSRDSIQSKHVEPEWRLALAHGKRIILVIFEACPLPVELQGCEWVDLRVSYKKRLRNLKEILESSRRAVAARPPQSGFKAPKRFWLALVLSVILFFASTPSWWTIVVPFILMPLPLQIYKRTYMFSRLVPLLFLMPALSLLSASLARPGNITYIILGESAGNAGLFVLASVTSWVLLALLLTPEMQRRATPTAARVRFANPLVLDVTSPRPVVFAIDYAPEDVRYAKDLRSGLERHGHRLAAPGEKPEAAFILISTYKKDTEYDPDRQAVYPVLLQAVGDIAPKLQRIQWIDFRKGIHNTDKLARLLPEPERLLKALAVAPAGSQEIFPLPVNALQYFYLIMGILGVGGLLTAILSLGASILRGEASPGNVSNLFILLVFGVLLLGAVAYSARGVRSRRGGTAAVYPLLVLTGFQGVTFLFSVAASTHDIEAGTLGYQAGKGPVVTLFALLIGIVLTFLFVLFGWRDLYRWLPQQQGDPHDLVERMLLLYSPSSKRGYLFHMLFHCMLLFVYLMLALRIGNPLGAFNVILILLALWFRWLARRTSRTNTHPIT